MNISFYRSKKWNKKYYWLIVFFLSALLANAQTTEIKVDVENSSLSEILKTLTEDYDFQISYNYSELSKYTLSVHKTFKTPEKTIYFLLRNLPFQIVNTGDVLIIKPRKAISNRKNSEQRSVSGQIVEFGSNEPLPNTQILVNGQQIYSDILGNFNYLTKDDSVFHLQVSHLGYFRMDTVLSSNGHNLIALKCIVRNLPEVTIKNNVIEKSALIGDKPGNLQLNHQISKYLPGQGDNSVFTLLRLMPGIQATGEQNNDLVIWGSYEGQSLITFDEFTLFGLRNYNENINVVNPFIIKSIEIDKGGYEAKYGNRVGGLVQHHR